MSKNPGPPLRRHGFSLIELLVVLALLFFLMGLLLALAVPRVRQAASSAQCLNNMRQLSIGMINLADSYRGNLPPLVGSFPGKDLARANGTVHFYLLPYIEQVSFYDLANTPKGRFVWHKGVWSEKISTFLCPSDPNPPKNNLYQDWLATTNYAGNWLVFGKGEAGIPRIFTDGTSNTIMFTERYQMCKDNPCGWGYPGLYYWMPAFAYYSQGKFQQRPRPEQCEPALPQGFHEGGINVAMADGSGRCISYTMSPQTWWYICTPNAGDIPGEDFDD